MKSIALTLFIAASFAGPLAAYAQTSQPLTRAQVKADLVSVQQAGYRPLTGNDPNYPTDAQAAVRKVAEQTAPGAGETSFGGDVMGTSQVGARGSVALSPNSRSYRIAH
jgi:hypothetical protein